MKISAKMATPQDVSHKPPKINPKTRFFSKVPLDFELFKQVPESSHQTGYFSQNQYIGTLILS